MRRIAARLIQVVVTLFSVLVVTFVLSRLSGDPAVLMLPDTATQEDVTAFRDALGLNEPLPVQFAIYVKDVVTLDFGNSIRSGEPALRVIGERLPASLELAGVSFVLGLVMSLLAGLAIELVRNRTFRTVALFLAVVREAIPLFVFGLALILIFAVQLRWFPAVGIGSWKHIVLPAITLGTLTLATYLRMLRSGFADEYERGYVRTARAKGLSRGHIVVKEAFPNVLLPVITVAGVNLGSLLTGSVIVEQVFGWPGVSSRILEAVSQRDYPVIQAGIIVLAVLYIGINLIVDLLYARIDPRIEGLV